MKRSLHFYAKLKNLTFPIWKGFMLLCIFSLCVSISSAQTLSVSDLLTDYRANPTEVDHPKPKFQWIVNSSLKNTKQIGYQIQLFKELKPVKKNNAIFWDSGWIASSSSINLQYSGS